MKKENLNKLIRQYSGDDLASYITDILDKEKTVRREHLKYQRGLEEAELEYNKVRMGIIERWAGISENCPHVETTYYPDASGGNDSETCCDWCGATL